jgi:hypothetical protein
VPLSLDGPPSHFLGRCTGFSSAAPPASGRPASSITLFSQPSVARMLVILRSPPLALTGLASRRLSSNDRPLAHCFYWRLRHSDRSAAFAYRASPCRLPPPPVAHSRTQSHTVAATVSRSHSSHSSHSSPRLD